MISFRTTLREAGICVSLCPVGLPVGYTCPDLPQASLLGLGVAMEDDMSGDISTLGLVYGKLNEKG